MRFTPINIAMACLLTWFITEWGNGEQALFTVSWLVVWLIVMTLVDIVFRVILKESKKLWLVELGFLLTVALVTFIIKLS